MNLRSWTAMLVMVALTGLLLTQAGCPSADQTPPPSVAGTSPGSSATSADPTPTPEEGPAPEETAPAAVGTPVEAKVPAGLPPLPIPEDNPLTAEKIALGKLLYFDTRLSKDGTISCATCHDPAMAWTDNEATSTGIGDQVGGANSPTVINAAYATSQFWDGRAASLEEQALGPIENPIEMGHKLGDLVTELAEVAEYKEAFTKAYGTPEVTNDRIAKAIASFERTVLSGNSPYDKKELNEAQKNGQKVFESAGCADCHTPPLFSNFRFMNAGIGMDKEKPDEGRKAVTGDEKDMGKFRVAPLREVANTGPYFHDGSVATLEEAVKIMAQGGIANDNLSGMLKAVGEEKLTDENIKDLVEFLKALSGEYPKE